jgi:hypothetical protein
MTPQIDFARHTAIRDRIRGTLEALKAEGVSTGELIEGLGNELHLLKIQDEREFEASTKSLTRSGADLLPTDHSKTTNR